MSSESAGKSTSGGIGLAGFLTIIFVILKLNPGGHLTTAIADWPWFEWWGFCVFCPMLWSFYAVIAFVAVCLVVIAFCAIIKALLGKE